MAGIAVAVLDRAGGPQIGGGQTWFTVEGQLAVVVGDPVTGHGEGAHAAPVMTEGSSWMTLDGLAVCKAGDEASCGHTTTGRSWFTIA